MDNLTQEQRHKSMSHIRSKETKMEKKLRLCLWHLGIRYRKNWTALPGKPDIVITRCRICIFVDGDFWHGKYKERPKTHESYWNQKIQRNIDRDKEINEILTEQGWLVLRYWESDLKKNFDTCLQEILSYIPYKRER